MLLDIVKIYQKYRIDFRTGGKHKHVRVGWVGAACPFCSGNPGYHLGYALKGQFKGRFVCWRCGGKGNERALIALLRLPTSEVKRIIRENSGKSHYLDGPNVDQETNVRRKAFKYPGGLKDLMPHHARYLEKRGFDPEKLVREWRIKSTGPIAPLVTDGKSLSYSHRIIIPIEWAGRDVSFQGRDVTNRHPLKYLACPKVREIIGHKEILYGDAPGKRAVLTEGATDVWKLGVGSLACFGVKFRLPQIKILASRYKEVILLFDPDEAGDIQGQKIKAELNFRGVNVIVEDCGDTDPGEMSYSDAAHLMKSFGL